MGVTILLVLSFLISVPVLISSQTAYGSFETPEESCPPRCKPGEFVNKNGVCSKQVQIGDKCSSTKVCEQAYAACSRGICSCMSGFVNINGHCYARKFTCPGLAPMTKAKQCIINVDECDDVLDNTKPTGYSAPNFGTRCLKEGGSVTLVNGLNRHKRHTTEGKMAYKYNGGCPAGTYCSVSEGFLVKGCHAYAIGHCCPHSCPIGEKHPTASCEPGAYNKCSKTPGYACHRNYLTQGAMNAFGEMIDNFFPATCCPTHCPPGWVTTEVGHCYPPAENLDHACWRDEQCAERQCSQAQCQCEPPLRRVVYPGGGEGCTNTTSTKLLGEPCSNDRLETCGVEHSKCWEGKCVCNCGYKNAGNTKCVKKGPCPFDVSYACGNWARQGECKKNPNWMVPNCPRACKAC